MVPLRTSPAQLWEPSDNGPYRPDRAALYEALSPCAENDSWPEQVTEEQIRDLAALQSAFLAVEAEKGRNEREALHDEVHQRTSSWPRHYQAPSWKSDGELTFQPPRQGIPNATVATVSPVPSRMRKGCPDTCSLFMVPCETSPLRLSRLRRWLLCGSGKVDPLRVCD